MKPTNISDPATRKRLIVSAGVLLALGLLALYALFDPGTSILAPKCPFKLLTGFDCPACGSQRTLHALLRGQWLAAFRYNPFLLLSVPYLLLVAYTTWSAGGPATRRSGNNRTASAAAGEGSGFRTGFRGPGNPGNPASPPSGSPEGPASAPSRRTGASFRTHLRTGPPRRTVAQNGVFAAGSAARRRHTVRRRKTTEHSPQKRSAPSFFPGPKRRAASYGAYLMRS